MERVEIDWPIWLQKGARTLHSADLCAVRPASKHPRRRRFSAEGPGTGTCTGEIVLQLSLMYRELNSRWRDANGRSFFLRDGEQELLIAIEDAPVDKHQAVTWLINLHRLLVEGLHACKVMEEKPGSRGSNRPSSVVHRYLRSKNFRDAGPVAGFIRDLSDVRAAHTHRENDGYKRAKERTGIDLEKDPTGGCRTLALRGLDMLKSLAGHLPAHEGEVRKGSERGAPGSNGRGVARDPRDGRALADGATGDADGVPPDARTQARRRLH